jgi:nitrogen fixation-related uncharacterized protein
MSIAYLLAALGLGVFAAAVWALFWAIDNGQYDEVEKYGSTPLGDQDHG